MKLLILLLTAFIFNVSYYAQEDSVTSGVNFDFGLTRNKNVNLWPVFKRSKTTTTTEISALLNLIGYESNSEFQLKHMHVLPVLFNTKSPDFKDFRIGTTYYPSLLRYTYDKDKESKTYSLGEIAPYIRFLQLSTSENGLEVDNNLFFFIWYNKSEIDKNTSFVTFPLVWFYKKPSSTYLTIPPFYSKGEFRDENGGEIKSYEMITPLHWKFKDKRDTVSFTLPLYYKTKNGISSSMTILPLLFNKKTSPSKSSLTMLPFYREVKKNDYKNIEGQKETSTCRMITPLLWIYNSNNAREKTLFPLFNYYKDSIKKRFVSPIYAYKKDQGFNLKMVTPLFWNIKTKYDTTKIFAPFYINQRSKNLSVSFIPFILAWKEKTNKTISYNQFPLLFTKNDYILGTKSQSIGLIFYHKKTSNSKVLRLFPIFGFKEELNNKRFVSPIFIRAQKVKDKDTTSTIAILPFYLNTTNPNRRFSTIFPIYWSHENANYKSIYLFPLGGYGNSKNEKRGFVNISPFYWKIKQPNKTKNFVLPLWYSSIEYKEKQRYLNIVSFNKIDTIQKKVFFPFLWRYKDNNEKKLTIFPFYWSKIDSNTTHKVFLPFYKKLDYHSKSKWNITTQKVRSYGILLKSSFEMNKYDNIVNEKVKFQLFPLYLYSKHINYSNNSDTSIYKYTIFFPLYWNFSDQSKSTNTNQKVLFPIYWRSKNDKESRLTILPLFSYRKITKFSKELFLAPIFHWKKNTYDTLFSVFPIFQYRHSLQLKRNYLLPLYYFHLNKKTNQRVSFITPFFWKNEQNHKKTTLFFPLFDYTRDTLNNLKNLGVIGVLFRYRSSPKEYSFKLLNPLISFQKSMDGVSFRISPVFWMKRSEKVSYHTILPMYYYQKSLYKTYFNILGGLYSFKRNNTENERIHRLFWSIFYKKISPEGKSVRLGYFLFKNIQTTKETEQGIFPFFSFEKNSLGKKTHSYLFKCFQSNELPIEGTTEKYKEVKVFWFIRIGSNYNYLHQKGLM